MVLIRRTTITAKDKKSMRAAYKKGASIKMMADWLGFSQKDVRAAVKGVKR